MRFSFFSQRAFTLVEVLTVMLVLVAIASITVESTKDFVFQGRYDVTKDRYEKIKKAIIGDPNQVINGQPNIEGFVKDVGRLPFKLEELTNGYCSANTVTNFYPDSVTCSAVPGTWNAKFYLSSKDVLKDGWGNDWIVNNPVTNLQSLGKDNLAGGTGYDTDYPANSLAIKVSDWKVNLSQIQIAINTPHSGSCSTPTCSDPIYRTQPSCQTPRAVWILGSPDSCSNAFYATQAECETLRGTWGNHNSKANCEAGGGVWSYNIPTNICIKIIRNATSSTTYDSNKTIYSDGRVQTIPFATSANVPMGNYIGLVLQGSCNTQITSSAYSSTHQNSICIDTNDDATNFIEGNCNGDWVIDNNGEKYCNGATGISCTTTLNGTEFPKFEMTLTPNTTLPTINW